MYSAVPNCRGRDLIPVFGSVVLTLGCTLLRSSFKRVQPKNVPSRWVCRTRAPSKMGFFVTLVNGFFCQRVVSTIFERLARKSVETARLQKKQLNNDTKNSILDVAGVSLPLL